MDQSLYDEFGNYIGPEITDDESEEEEEEFDKSVPEFVEESTRSVLQTEESSINDEKGMVRFQNQNYYPSAKEVYGNVETLIEEEDTQPITQPIIAPVQTKDFDAIEKHVPETTFSYDFLAGLMFKPSFIRMVCVIGSFHCGKTSLMDILVSQTHNIQRRRRKTVESLEPLLYTDSRKDEICRGLSVKAVPLSLVLQSSADKSYLIHIYDTPGHVNFQDEAAAAMRICDGVVLVVDALSGVMCNTEKLLLHALRERLKITVVINCIDRLILELRLPPTDAYFKLRHTIEEINHIVRNYCETFGLPLVRFSPVLGNVAFASSMYGFIFTLKSFTSMYTKIFKSSSKPLKGGWMRGLQNDIDVETFVKCLWGNLYYDHSRGKFCKTPSPENEGIDGEKPETGGGSSGPYRSFVEFILLPIYKLFSHTVGEEKITVQPLLEDLGIYLKEEMYKLDTKTLLKIVCGEFFGDARYFIDMLIEWLPSPVSNALVKTSHIYTGNLKSEVALGMLNLNKDSVLMVHTTKNYHRPDCKEFDVFGRVMSGTIHVGEEVKILGEAYSLEDTEDMEIRVVTHLWVYQAGRYRVEISHVPAGNWVLIGGISQCVTKTSTITSVNSDSRDIEIFSPLRFSNKSVIRVSCEPLNPSELPKMLEGFRRVSKSYPLCQTKVEESGEHVILGTGEIYMDCVLHDLRKLYGDLEIKVADPVVQFCETVVETSAVKCFADTPNKKNRLHFIAEPLEKGLAEDIERGYVKWYDHTESSNGNLVNVLTSKYRWDLLAARSIKAFGPDNAGPNILIDDTIKTEVDKNLLDSVMHLIVQGFRWVTKEGPLIEEAIRGCKFRLLDASIASEIPYRGGGQIIPTARRVAYSAFLLATPRLLEPVLFVEIECPADCVSAVYTVLARRRGHVAKDMPKPGTPLYIVHAYLPAIESFGFETDLRTHTSGQTFCLSLFDHWALVPGDPLDKSIVLRPLEPAPIPHLGREFLLKTRRRKGLSENVAIDKFFDDPMLVELAKQEADIDHYF